MYTISGTQTVYARVTHTTTAQTPVEKWGSSITDFHLDIGNRAWGRVADASREEPPAGVVNYDISTTSGATDLILNHAAGTGHTDVTIAFFKDQALTLPHYVENLEVPLDDMSAQETYYRPLLTAYLRPRKSYQELWSVTGTTASGTVTPTKVRLENTYNGTSTVDRIAGSGTQDDPWHWPRNLMNASRNQVGGNLITRFSQPVSSVTVRYSSAADRTGPQGAGLGRLTMCA